jgi:hypothetical protein
MNEKTEDYVSEYNNYTECINYKENEIVSEEDLKLLHWYINKYREINVELSKITIFNINNKRQKPNDTCIQELEYIEMFIRTKCIKHKLSMENIFKISNITGRLLPVEWNRRIKFDYYNNDYSIEMEYRQFKYDYLEKQFSNTEEMQLMFFGENKTIKINE